VGEAALSLLRGGGCGKGSDLSRSLTHIDILNIYRTIMMDSISKKKTSFEHCLGAPVDVFLVRLKADVFSNNVEQTWKKYATSNKEVLNSDRRLIASNKQENDSEKDAQVGEETDCEASQMRVACNLFDELLSSEKKDEEQDKKEGCCWQSRRRWGA
jgi:hypothetical protein